MMAVAPRSWSPAVMRSARRGAGAQRTGSLPPARAVLGGVVVPAAEHPPARPGRGGRDGPGTCAPGRSSPGLLAGSLPSPACGERGHLPQLRDHSAPLGGCSSALLPLSQEGGGRTPPGRVPREPFPPRRSLTALPSPLCSFLFLSFCFCFHHDVPSLSPLCIPPPLAFFSLDTPADQTFFNYTSVWWG